jgi:hypothetical protein
MNADSKCNPINQSHFVDIEKPEHITESDFMDCNNIQHITEEQMFDDDDHPSSQFASDDECDNEYLKSYLIHKVEEYITDRIMTPPNINENYIENSEIVMHSNILNDNLDILEDNEHFGIIKLKMKKAKLTQTPTLFIFTIDNSGSMNEKSYNKNKKIDVVINTFKSIVKYLSSLSASIYITVQTFNDNTDLLVDAVLVNKTNVNNIITKIENIDAESSTNIGLALLKINEIINTYSTDNPTHQIVNIFMTDGDATIGEQMHTNLCDMVNTTVPNIFVGFGEDHNIKLMRKLSDLKNSDYQFVDNMENTSMIYGETINRYLYPALKNVEIEMTDGLIYNWKTNTWEKCLEEPIIIGEIEKIYHIKTTNPQYVLADIYGILYDNINDTTNYPKTCNHLISAYTTHDTDLTKYMYRQKTLEILYKSKDENNYINENALRRERDLQLEYFKLDISKYNKDKIIPSKN